MNEITVVVPCFEEGSRFRAQPFLEFLADSRLALLLVDDGSRDETNALLAAFAARFPARVSVLTFLRNRGKAEAVRAGMLAAIAGGARMVGYFDADLATPVSEFLRLIGVLEASGAKAVLGSRVKLLGRDVRRSTVRHYLGRAFATGAALTLGIAVYDTQCGAKLFVDTPELRAALAEGFASRWFFDVELIGRILVALPAPARNAYFIEEPLETWHAVAGSKLRVADMSFAFIDLARVALVLRRRR
jgi:glycosyltransferase involved in cell wall biosynthesis